MIIRFVLAPLFTYPFDIEHWAVIMQNIESGNGLFGLTGYFYTPVWGYILGFEDLIYNTFLSLGDYGLRVDEMLPIEHLGNRFNIATVTTLAFNLAMKAPFVLCDVLIGYILFRTIAEDTGSEKKATMGFMIWFFCPIVIYMSSVQAMFDCFSALFALLTVLLLRKDKPFLAGVMFCLGALIKFFPVFCIVLFCIYVIRKNREGKWSVELLKAFAGAAVTAVIIFLPTILDGTFNDAFSFVFERTKNVDIWTELRMYLSFALTGLAIVLTAWKILKARDDELDLKLVKYSVLILCCITLLNLGPQYCIVFVPLMAYYIAVTGKRPYLYCLIAITVLSAISGFFNNSLSVMATASVSWGIWSPEWVIDSMRYLEGIQVWIFNLPGAMVFFSERIKLVVMLFLILLIFSEELGGKLAGYARTAVSRLTNLVRGDGNER